MQKARKNKMVINVHAGHNPAGKVASGAAGYLIESVEDRIVKDKVIELLRENGHTVYDCTEDNGTSQQDVLNKIIEKCNSHNVDIDVSIHFNAGAADRDTETTGTEVYVYGFNAGATEYADRVLKNISNLGFRNRGIKVNQSLAVLRRTKAPAMLVECCFVDDKDDAALYDADKMARAIAGGIINADLTAAQKTYTVKRGDSLWKIAQEQLGNGARYKEIVNANGLVNNTIHPGDKLIMPN